MLCHDRIKADGCLAEFAKRHVPAIADPRSGHILPMLAAARALWLSLERLAKAGLAGLIFFASALLALLPLPVLRLPQVPATKRRSPRWFGDPDGRRAPPDKL